MEPKHNTTLNMNSPQHFLLLTAVDTYTNTVGNFTFCFSHMLSPNVKLNQKVKSIFQFRLSGLIHTNFRHFSIISDLGPI